MPFWKKEKPTADDSPRQEQPASGGAAAGAAPGVTSGQSAAFPEPGSATPSAGSAQASGSPAPAAPASTAIDATMLEAKVVEVIRTCYDPEIPVNVYELGLIYEVNVKPSGDVYVKMTLTSPMCPVAGTLPPEIEAKVASVTGVKSAQVDVVWEPPWSPEKMSEAAKLQLGML